MRIKSYNSRERANRNEYFPAILHHPRRDQQQAASRRNSSMCQEIAGTHPPRSMQRVSNLSPSITRRHTFISHALAGGRTLAEVRDAVEHGSVSITSGYLHVAVDNEDAAGNLFPCT